MRAGESFAVRLGLSAVRFFWFKYQRELNSNWRTSLSILAVIKSCVLSSPQRRRPWPYRLRSAGGK